MLTDDKRYKKVYKLENLELAWRRITTSTSNLFYKNYYRQLFILYELDLSKNLTLLSEKLKKHIYQPANAIKFYKPKQNGLLRPFTFLELEDLIVYQAMANVLIVEVVEKRRKFEYKTVFSNIFSSEIKDNIFLYEKWKKGYFKYKRNIANNFKNGYVYTAHFDLAAYYDTIDHNSLTASLMRDKNTEFSKLLDDCLLKWANPTTIAAEKKIHHSIPQGPLSSSVFAELFLLPIDEKMMEQNIVYSRYVDDIVIQGNSLNEVMINVAFLDKQCKIHGLIPQSTKLKIFKANSVEEAIGKRPSIDAEEKKELFSSAEEVKKLFESSFSEENFDSTAIRYILKSYKESDVLVPIILQQFFNHYELVEEFCIYLKHFADAHFQEYIATFYEYLIGKSIPYDYIEKELWELFGTINMLSAPDVRLINFSINRLKEHPSEEVRYGIYVYLSSLNDNRFMSFLQFEESVLMQLLQVKYISPSIVETAMFHKCIQQLGKRSSETLIPLIERHIRNYLLFNEIDINTYTALQLKMPQKKHETVNHFFNKDYGITISVNWKSFFGSDYKQMNELIYYIHVSKKIDKTAWINLVDTFCDMLLKILIKNLRNHNAPIQNLPYIVTYKNNRQRPADHGTVINGLITNTIFLSLANSLKAIHERRCSTPYSHPKDFKTMKQSTLLTNSEQNKFIGDFKKCINEVISIIKQYNL